MGSVLPMWVDITGSKTAMHATCNYTFNSGFVSGFCSMGANASCPNIGGGGGGGGSISYIYLYYKSNCNCYICYMYSLLHYNTCIRTN